MNSFSGKITALQTEGKLTLVSVDCGGQIILKSIVIETPETASYLKIGGSVKVLFKETEVIIGKKITTEVSLQNQIGGQVENIEKNELLSKVSLASPLGNIHAIISTNAFQNLNLNVGGSAVAMIKLNEIMLSAE